MMTRKNIVSCDNGKETTFETPTTQKQNWYPVSAAQKLIFVLSQLQGENTQFNMPTIFSIEGKLELVKLKKIFQHLIERYEVLRTSYTIIDGEPVQRINQEMRFDFEYIQVSQSEIEKRIQQFIQPFDLLEGRLLRVRVIHVDKALLLEAQESPIDTHILVVDMHQIIADTKSLELLLADFVKLYRGDKLEPVQMQYKDIVGRQSNSGVDSEQERYWMNTLSGELAVGCLKTDRPRPQKLDWIGDSIMLTLDNDVSQELRKLALKEEVSLYTVLLAIYNILLARYTNQEEMIVGTTVPGRRSAELEKAIGFFENTLVLRNYPKLDLSFRQFLRELNANVLQAFEHQEYPFGRLINRLALGRSLNKSPLFDAMFVMLEKRESVIKIDNLLIRPYAVDLHRARFDLFLEIHDTPEIGCKFEYATQLFEDQTIRQMVNHFHNIVLEVVQDSQIKIGNITMISTEEKDRLINQFNHTQIEYPADKTLQELFEHQVLQNLEKPAVVLDEQILTYGELNRWVNRLARSLRQKGVGPGSVVGVIAERSVETIVGVLAIVKAGGAYLPIDLKYPSNRIKYMFSDAGVKILLTQGGTRFTAAEFRDIDFIDIPSGQTTDSLEDTNLKIVNTSSDLIYIIYTSGSTGEPKGVMIEQRNVNRLISNSNMLKIRPTEHILQTGSLAFDASTFEIWGSLLNGASLYLISEHELLSATGLKERIKEYQISMLWLTSPLFNQLLEEDLGFLQGVQTLIVGGDVLSVRHIKVAQKLYPQLTIINGYGPTESTTFTTYFVLEDQLKDTNNNIPIGKPVSNTQVYILNQSNSLQPVGLPGELCIGGDGLARGYLNRPELTEEKFVDNPFKPNEKMYRSGDLACWLADGNIEFLGRIDQQVKIRGFRVEPGEIEVELRKCSGIQDALVIAKTDITRQKGLCAYYVASERIPAAELRDQLAATLPEYMLPTYFCQLDRFPLNPNGKIDRQALPESGERYCGEAEFAAPMSELEEQLVNLWLEILQIGKIGVTDNFFELGGHSLKAVKMITRIHQELDILITPQTLFLHPTIRDLANVLSTTKREIFDQIKPAAEAENYPLSSGQMRLWILDQLGMGGTAYNITGSYLFEDSYEPSVFRKTLSTLIKRHESLRTIFLDHDGQPVQKIVDGFELQINELNLSRVSNPESRIQEIITTESKIVFDLAGGPLFKITVIQVNRQHIFFFTLHHIIADGWSMDIFKREFEQLYTAYQAGGSNPLSPLRIQYKDYAVWQSVQPGTDKFNKHRDYWHQQLAGELKPLKLPVDYPHNQQQDQHGGVYRFILPAEVQRQLQDIVESRQVSMFMVLLTTFMTFLSRLTGEEDLIVGVPVAGREHADLKELIGFFLNTLVIRERLNIEKNFLANLNQVKQTVLQALDHQVYPFELLDEEMQIISGHSQPSVLSVMFNMLNFETNTGGELTDYQNQHLNFPQGVKFDLGCLVTEFSNGIVFDCQYRMGLFKKETVEYLMNQYRSLIFQAARRVELPVKEYKIFTRDDLYPISDKIQLTSPFVEFSRTEIQQSIAQRFEKQVAKDGNKLAVKCKKKSLTYGALNAKANQIAAVILAKCVRSVEKNSPEHRVALLFGQDSDMIQGILGVVKSGKIYVPLDVSHPDERLVYILKDSGAKLLLTNAENENYAKKLVQSIQGTPGMDLEEKITILNIDLISDQIPTANLDLEIPPEQIAYILYTSGSTGKPKGVMQTNRNVLHFIRNYTNNLHISADDRLTLFSSYSFDAAVMDIYGALLNGSTLYPYNLLLDGSITGIINWLRDEQITIFHAIPTVYRYFTESLTTEEFMDLRLIVLGGEEVLQKDVTAYQRLFSDKVILINGLGPTESTVTLQYFINKDTKITRLSVPVGYPVEETEVILLAEDQQEVGVFGIGEIVYKSPYLAPGYWNDLETTAAVFTADPRTGQGRVYRSGDLGQLLPDGSIVFVGRRDSQVKIRGYRIELSEIESVLDHLEGIKKSAVTVVEEKIGEKYLVGYYIGKTGQELDTDKLRNLLRSKLPDYMVPTYFVQLDHFPLTATGKIDKRNLPAFDRQIELDSGDLLPTTDVESHLARLWSEILHLQVENISVNRSFFDLGGDSLKLIRVTDAINQQFATHLKVTDLLTYTTIREIAGVIQPMDQDEVEKKVVKFTF